METTIVTSHDYIEVSKELFYKVIYDNKLDVGPYAQRDSNRTNWKFTKTNQSFGYEVDLSLNVAKFFIEKSVYNKYLRK